MWLWICRLLLILLILLEGLMFMLRKKFMIRATLMYMVVIRLFMFLLGNNIWMDRLRLNMHGVVSRLQILIVRKGNSRSFRL